MVQQNPARRNVLANHVKDGKKELNFSGEFFICKTEKKQIESNS